VEKRGTRVNMNKIKVMISGEWQKVTQKAVRRPYGVCGRGFDKNSIQCTSCQKWVHKIKDSMYKLMKTFVCIGCMNPETDTGHTNVDTCQCKSGVSGQVLLFRCILLLSVDGDDDAAVETRIRIGWNKFRHLVRLLTNKDIS